MYKDGSPRTGGPPGSQGGCTRQPGMLRDCAQWTAPPASPQGLWHAHRDNPQGVRDRSQDAGHRPGAQTTLAGMSRKDSRGPGNGLQGRGTLRRAAHAASHGGHLFSVAHRFIKPNVNAQPAVGVDFLFGSSSGIFLQSTGVRRSAISGGSVDRVTQARVPTPRQMPRGPAARTDRRCDNSVL